MQAEAKRIAELETLKSSVEQANQRKSVIQSEISEVSKQVRGGHMCWYWMGLDSAIIFTFLNGCLQVQDVSASMQEATQSVAHEEERANTFRKKVRIR